jgi:ubiquinone/menaquinone biosynthesis C-methylase UbiE
LEKSVVDYYNNTAASYEMLHGDDRDREHIRALERSWIILESLSIKSALDVGCGTGRALRWLYDKRPSVSLFGIDPSSGLLDIARRALPNANLQIGSGERLPFPDDHFDIVIATGIMHHVDQPSIVINEMFRVAKRAVLISDHNNFAFGGRFSRRARLLLRSVGLLQFATYIKQGFRRQGYSADDGWWYPYSLFESYADITMHSQELYIIPTRQANLESLGNLILTQSHFAILAFKESV